MGTLQIKYPIDYFQCFKGDIGPCVPTGLETAYEQGARGSGVKALFSGDSFLILGSNFENTWQIRCKKTTDSVWITDWRSILLDGLFPQGLVVRIGHQIGVDIGTYEFEIADDYNGWIPVPGTLKVCQSSTGGDPTYWLQQMGMIAWAYYPPYNIGRLLQQYPYFTDHNASLNYTLMYSIGGVETQIPNPNGEPLDQFDSGYVDIPWVNVYGTGAAVYFLKQTTAGAGPVNEVVSSQLVYQLLDRHPAGLFAPFSPLNQAYNYRTFFRWDAGNDIHFWERNCVYKAEVVAGGNVYDLGNVYAV